MSNTTLPRRRAVSGRWLLGGIVLIVIAIVAALVLNGRASDAAAEGPSTVTVKRGSLTATVAGSGAVAAEQALDITFETNGTLSEVLVAEGETVQAGQVLARLDDRNLKLQLANAQNSLLSAQARLAQAQQGNARPEDLAAAQAQVAQAQASYNKITAGPTAEELASAQAAVRSAQAAYDAAAKASETTGSSLESAAAAMQKAEASVRRAQAAYDRVASNPDIGRRQESLDLQTATIEFEQATANYDALAHTSAADAQSKVASAEATLAQARYNLAKLEPAADDVASAQASLDQAQANLAKLTASATATDLQIQEAAVAQAQSAVEQAQLSLDMATLKAPFDGIVAAVYLDPGNLANSATPVLKLINRSTLHVDLKLSENDVARVVPDQLVKLRIESLDGWQAEGRVSYVAPAAETTNGVVTYAVRVAFPDNDPRVKVGMTADLDIITAEKANVLLAPNTALLPKGAAHVVQILEPAAGQGAPGPAKAGASVTREIEVQTGLTDGTQTEILSGLQEGDAIVTLPTTGAPRGSGGGFPLMGN
jgi:HlyD family secretion protein